MKNIKLKDYEFNYPEQITAVCDEKQNKLAFISETYDLLLFIKIENNKLLFQPEMEVDILEINEYSYKIVDK